MIVKLAKRFLTETDLRLLFKFGYDFGWKGMRAVQKFEARKRKGGRFPAFVVLSITNQCNLDCQGCWVTQTRPPQQLSLEQMDQIVCSCKQQGSYFFGILGGEPFLHKDLFALIAKHPDCYFQIFTNGTVITDELAGEMRRLGNVTPLISVEGDAVVSDERRGGSNVYDRTLTGLEHCHRNKLITGVATSVCKSNIDTLVTDKFVNSIIERGALYLWYYIYRPVGKDPHPELVLDEDEILRLRQFMVDRRCTSPIVLVDAYWDHLGRALCPGACGISHHIGPSGAVEFCPPMQFAKDYVASGNDFSKLLEDSEFMEAFRTFSAGKTRGCVLLDCPDELREFLEEQGADDSSGRDSAFAELAAMCQCPGHHLPGKEIPEKSWMYRFAKKNWFFGFGAYG